jgi:hypothetical protein
MPRKRKRRPVAPETTLYAPVKRYLEALGFAVKGEVCGCDLVALRGDEPPIVVIGELKLAFGLELVLQGIDRADACDEVWLAVRVTGRGGRVRDPRVHKLCRLLGFGLLGVSSSGLVDVLVEPKPWRPHRDLRRRARLIREHQSRHGDPALGGSARSPIMTAYRQRALACAASLAGGPRAPPKFVQRSPTLPVFYCATSTAGSAAFSAASTSSLRKALRRSPDGLNQLWPRSPLSRRYQRHNGWVARTQWFTRG